MKKMILFGAIALVVGTLSSFRFNVVRTCWYRQGGTDFSGPTDQTNCAPTLVFNCTITDALGVHGPLYDSEANIGDEAHICKYADE